MDELRKASKEKDGDLLMRSAHSLKGMLKNFQADSAAEAAFELEIKGKSGDFDGVQENIEALEDRMTEVDKMLRDMIQ
jgi:HPt (histidine-containing phosphotransfer) domain-containing protein